MTVIGAIVGFATGSVKKAVLATAFGLVGVLAGAALPKQPGGRQNTKQEIPPRRRGYGTVRLGGSYMLYETKDGDFFSVMALFDGQLDGVEAIYLSDRVVTLAGDAVQELDKGAYSNDAVHIQLNLGLPTETAFAQITSRAPEVWTEDHRGDGIASLSMVCYGQSQKNQQTVYPDGLPQASVVVRTQRVLDPRTGQVAFTKNPALALADYLVREVGLDYASYIAPELPALIVAADVCDEEVTVNGGFVEPRYACGGFFEADTDPAQVMGAIGATFDGWMAQTGSGAIRIVAGRFYEPTVTIPAAHIRAYSVRRFVADEEAVNEVVSTYTSPEHAYSEVQTAPLRNDEDILARGLLRSQRVDRGWVQSPTQCRRLDVRIAARQNGLARGSVQTSLFGLQALGERYITIEIPDLPSLVSFSAEVQKIAIDLVKCSCTIDWIAVDASVDVAGDVALPVVPGQIDGVTIGPPTGLTVAPSAGDAPFIITVTVDPPPPHADGAGWQGLGLIVAWRFADVDGAGEVASETFDGLDLSGPVEVILGPTLPIGDFEFRASWVSPYGTAFAYSAGVEVTLANGA
jgi:hypothetical protein